MSLLNVFDFAENLLLVGAKDTNQSKIKPPRILIIFYILLVLSVVWIAVEAKSIANLQSPVLFLLFFGIIGIVLSFIIMYFLWRTGVVQFFTKRFAFVILVPILLLTIAGASTLNAPKNENGRLGFDIRSKP